MVHRLGGKSIAHLVLLSLSYLYFMGGNIKEMLALSLSNQNTEIPMYVIDA